jgi:thiol-disulfide isomerase/thioredoxin
MRRLICGLLALALAAPGLRAEDKPAKAEDYKALQKEFEQAQTKLQEKQKELIQAFQKAKTPEEKKEIVKKFEAAQKEAGLDKFGGRFLAFAEKNPKSPDAYDALFHTLRLSGGPMGPSGLWGKAIAALQKDHVKHENMAKLARMLGSLKDEATLKLLKAIVEKNPDRKAQAYACKALAKSPNKDDADKYAKLLKDKYTDVFPDLSVGKKAPEVVSQDLSGKKVKLSDYKGKVVVLDIWATWCGPCKAMIPHERELVKRLKDKPFALISISADEKKETLTKFLGETPMPWTHWWNGADGGILADWEINSFPTVYIIDGKGIIRDKINGFRPGVTDKKMDETVETLLKEMGVKIEPAKDEKKDSGKDKKDS